MVDVAQLVRAPDCDSGCRGFESHRPPHLILAVKYLRADMTTGGSVSHVGSYDGLPQQTADLHRTTGEVDRRTHPLGEFERNRPLKHYLCGILDCLPAHGPPDQARPRRHPDGFPRALSNPATTCRSSPNTPCVRSLSIGQPTHLPGESLRGRCLHPWRCGHCSCGVGSMSRRGRLRVVPFRHASVIHGARRPGAGSDRHSRVTGFLPGGLRYHARPRFPRAVACRIGGSCGPLAQLVELLTLNQ